jgi:hypothetical protein
MSLSSFAQRVSTADAVRCEPDPVLITVQQSSTIDAAEFVIWSEDFSNGIPSTWLNSGTANGSADPDAVWAYRSPTTTPSDTVGSQGGYSGSGTPIASVTASNGFVIFDSDFLDNAGIAGNFGNGIAPGPQKSELITGLIDLSSAGSINLNFTQYYRRFEGPGASQTVPATYIDFSTDGGATFPYSVTLNSNISINSSTPINDLVSIPASYLGGQDSVKIRFRWDGHYYFWMIDDINISATANNSLIGYWSGNGSVYDINYSGGINQGHMANSQSQSIVFSANVYNDGLLSQSGTRLKVNLLQNGALVSTISGTGVILSPGDSAILSTIAWTPPASGNYQWVYLLESDSIPPFAISDTIDFNHQYSMSMDFNSWDNSIGASTNSSQWGDGSQMCQKMKILNNDTLYGVQVWLSQLTQPGSFLYLSVYDAIAFGPNLGSGMNWNNNLLRGYGQKVISATDIAQGFVYFDFTSQTSSGIPLYSAVGEYFLNLTMYNNSGSNYIAIRNDQTFTKSTGSGWMYLAGLGNWYSGYSGSKSFNNLWIRADLDPVNVCNSSPVYSNGLNGQFCPGDTIQVSMPNFPGRSYLWNTGDTTSSIDIHQAGNYSVIYSTAGGCTDTVYIIASPFSAAINYSGSLDFCIGGSVTLTAAAGQSYLWSTGATTQSITVSQAGSYYAVVTTASGCFDTTATYTTTFFAAPDISVVASGSLDFCIGGSVTLTAAAGQSYLWNTGATTQSITTTQAGSYSAIVTTTNGCVDTTATYTTTFFAGPDTYVTTSGSLDICSGGSVTLTAAPGQSYLWSTGATAQSITTSQAGSYYVIVTETTNGCVDTSATYTTTVTPLPTPIIVATQLKICPGQTVTLSTQTSHTSYLWGGGASGTQDSLVVGAGTFWLTVSDTSGCSGTDTITITELVPYTTQPEVCIVTNDPVSGFNQVIWERSSKQGTEYYNVYRDGIIGYTKIGSRGVNQLSQLTDNSANPGLQPYKYYVTIVDSCGNEHGSSVTEHSTIHLQSNIGTSGEVNLVWTSYSGRTPLYYRIYRKAASDSVFTTIDSVNLANNSYTDFNPPSGFTKYQIAAVMGSGCNSSNKTGVTTSLSNASTQNTVSLREDVMGVFAISPNPNNGYFRIEVDQRHIGSSYRIIDFLGRIIETGTITKPSQDFDLSDKPKGVYRIQVSNEKASKTLNVVIQ